MKFKIIPHQLQFNFKAATSRGVYTTHDIWYIVLDINDTIGIGEIAPLRDLSIDAVKDIKDIIKIKLEQLFEYDINVTTDGINHLLNNLKLDNYPSVRFGLEMALLDILNGGKRILFNNSFSRKESNILINGLIWMGDKNFMFRQVKEKIKSGFSCIKMKIGAINFDQECEILKYIRQHFSVNEIEIRVDANGAFDTKNVLEKLEKLSQFQIHSIEQPIKPNQWEEMNEICMKLPIPIALDEELIGINGYDNKMLMLKKINPKYIILKPTLLGGIYKSNEWIDIAERLDIKWWFTSALESNIGLNAISQFTSEFDNNLPQGLGTGGLYTNNIPSPLTVENGFIRYDKNKEWDLAFFGIHE